MSGIVIRIFSGVHMGAELSLSDGAWVFGRDDSADIVLADAGLSPRHAVLKVEGATVRFENLEGKVESVRGEEILSGELEPGALWRMGPVLFAWASDQASDAVWENAEGFLRRWAQEAELEGASEKPYDDRRKPEMDKPQEEASGEAPEKETAAGEEPSGKAEGQGGGMLKGALFVIVLLPLFCGLMLVPRIQHEATAFLRAHDAEAAADRIEVLFARSNSEKEASERFEALKKTLAHAFPKVRAVREKRSGSGFFDASFVIRISGIVANDAERGALLRLARSEPDPIELDLKVESDYANAVASAFNALGYWPLVTLEDGGKPGAEAALRVSGFMRTALLEEKAFRDVRDAMPRGKDGKPLEVTRRILHENELRPLVERVLKGEKLSGVGVDYLDGSIRLVAELTPEASERLRKVEEQLRQASGIPLKIDIAEEALPQPQRPEAAKAQTKPTSSGSKPEFRVTAVSGGAIRFITLSTGEKVFEGGKLPGGFVLEKIASSRLTLSKSGNRITYPLQLQRGTK